MDNRTLVKVTDSLRKQRDRKKWRKTVGILGALVLVATVAALVLPAFTLARDPICGLEEHVHTESCYTETPVLSCGLEETPGHSHTDECYTESSNLVCGVEESEEHAHTESCYETERTLICQTPETQGHTHDEACYTTEQTLTCEKAEHTHTEECYGPDEDQTSQEEAPDSATENGGDPNAALDSSLEDEAAPVTEETPSGDPTADLESRATWKASISAVTLTGNWAEDVLSIADSQLGYQESGRNFITDENGRQKGYSRYGAWYGDAYGDWCAMFASFCLHYADIPADEMPREASCPRWISQLTKEGIYAAAASYDPKPGDLVFFDVNQDGISDHVGLVYDVDGERAALRTIEGNSNDAVSYVDYSMDDGRIMGYGMLPENPELAGAGNGEAPSVSQPPQEALRYYYYSGNGVTVTVALPGDSPVPADAKLVVTPITEDGGYDYEDLTRQAGEAVEGDVEEIVLYDISFFTAEGEYLPVEENAVVTISFAETILTESQGAVKVVHLPDEAPAQALEDASVAEEALGDGITGIEFKTPGFSAFAVLTVSDAASFAAEITSGESYVILNGSDTGSYGITISGNTLGVGQVGTVETIDGAVHVTPAEGGADFAQWTFTSTGTEYYYTIQETTSGKYLSVSGTSLTLSDTSTSFYVNTTDNQANAVRILYLLNNSTWYCLYIDADGIRLEDSSSGTAQYQTLAKAGSQESGSGGSGGTTTASEAFVVLSGSAAGDYGLIVTESNGTYTLGTDTVATVETVNGTLCVTATGGGQFAEWVLEPGPNKADDNNFYYVRLANTDQYLYLKAKTTTIGSYTITTGYEPGLTNGEKTEFKAVADAAAGTISIYCTYSVTVSGNTTESTYYLDLSGGTVAATLRTGSNEVGSLTMAKNATVTSQEPSPGESGGGTPELKLKPTAGKKASLDADGDYNLELSVSSSAQTTVNPPQYDVVFVVDQSGSMGSSSITQTSGGTTKTQTRLAWAEEAVTDYTAALAAKAAANKVDARCRLVTFSSTADAPTAWAAPADFSCTLTASGGTNYQDAFYKLGTALADVRPEAITVVIFLTDGAPTRFCISEVAASSATSVTYNGKYYEFVEDGTAYTAESGFDASLDSTNGGDWTFPYKGAQAAGSGITCDYFYGIALDPDSSDESLSNIISANGITGDDAAAQMMNILSGVTTNVTARKTMFAGVDLENYFAGIETDTSYVDCDHVAVTDTLSDYVEPVDGDAAVPVIKVEEIAADGTKTTHTAYGSLTLQATDMNSAATLTAGVATDSAGQKVVALNFPDGYRLEDGWNYSVILRIKPSAAAEQYYAENGAYPATVGDANTGDWSEQTGFYSNVEGQLTYSVNGTQQDPIAFAHPVVRVSASQESGGGGGTPADPVMPTTSKTAADRGDGTYDLTLGVSSNVQSTATQVQYDVLFVVDVSASMINNQVDNQTRLYWVNQGINDLAAELTADPNVDANCSLITFNGAVVGTQDWTPSENFTVALEASGGTNYQTALYAAGDQIATAREGAVKVVIFLTDGAPTDFNAKIVTDGAYDFEGVIKYGPYKYSSSDTLQFVFDNGADSSRYSAYTYDYTTLGQIADWTLPYRGALYGAGHVTCDYFYGIGFGITEDTQLTNLISACQEPYGISSADDLLSAVAGATNSGNKTAADTPVRNITNATSLATCFDDIQAAITHVACDNVTITDTLSNYVELTDGDTAVPVITVEELAADGTKTTVDTGNGSLTLPATEMNVEATLTAGITTNSAGKKVVTLDFPDDYKLENNWHYSVTIRIQPSNEAEHYYTDNGGVYPHTGDPDTGDWSGQTGFYSNVEGQLTYSVDGTQKDPIAFAHPVVRVGVGLLTVTKTDKDGSSRLGGATFALTAADGSSQARTTAFAAADTVDDPAEGTVAFSIQPGTIYTVSETAAPTGYRSAGDFRFRVVETADGAYAVEFCDADGQTAAAPGYVSGCSAAMENGALTAGFTVHNDADQMTITVVKKWRREVGAAVQMQLWRSPVIDGNGNTVDGVAEMISTLDMTDVNSTGEVPEADASDGVLAVWTGDFGPVPLSENGVQYKYYVVEDYTSVNGYSVQYIGERMPLDGMNDVYGILVPTSALAENNGAVTVEVVNTAGQALPQTGGAGTWRFALSGLTLLLLGMVLTVRRGKRKQGAN